jgi:hypothetical protein
LKGFEVVYLCDANVSLEASKAIADWVQKGGNLVATAGAGMFDEFNRPNRVLRELLGVEQTKIEEAPGNPIRFEKQDLPFAKPISDIGKLSKPVYGLRSHITFEKELSSGVDFKDGKRAIVFSRRMRKGHTVYLAYLPGLSYFKEAFPLRPMDRSARDDGMTHYLPSSFEKTLVLSWARNRPVESSEPLVETTVIEAPQGVVIPLINWKGKDGLGVPIKNLQVTVNIPVPTGNVSLASGRPVAMKQENGATIFTLDLDVADALILRK